MRRQRKDQEPELDARAFVPVGGYTWRSTTRHSAEPPAVEPPAVEQLVPAQAAAPEPARDPQTPAEVLAAAAEHVRQARQLVVRMADSLPLGTARLSLLLLSLVEDAATLERLADAAAAVPTPV